MNFVLLSFIFTLLVLANVFYVAQMVWLLYIVSSLIGGKTGSNAGDDEDNLDGDLTCKFETFFNLNYFLCIYISSEYLFGFSQWGLSGRNLEIAPALRECIK